MRYTPTFKCCRPLASSVEPLRVRQAIQAPSKVDVKGKLPHSYAALLRDMPCCAELSEEQKQYRTQNHHGKDLLNCCTIIDMPPNSTRAGVDTSCELTGVVRIQSGTICAEDLATGQMFLVQIASRERQRHCDDAVPRVSLLGDRRPTKSPTQRPLGICFRSRAEKANRKAPRSSRCS